MITQADIGSSQQFNSPKFLIGAHQTRARADTANTKNRIAIVDNLNFQKVDVERDGVRDNVLLNYEQNEYNEKYKDLKLNCKEYVGEELMTPFKYYPDMKTKYSIEIISLRHQPDQTTAKKVQLFHDYSADPEKARFF